MITKPFKPPLLRPPSWTGSTTPASATSPERRQPKHVSDSDGADEEVGLTKAALPFLKPPVQNLVALDRKPLLALSQPHGAQKGFTDGGASTGPEGTFDILWRKPSTKKHKTWDGDGTLIIAGGNARLCDESGKALGKTTWSKHEPPEMGSELSIGGKVVLVHSLAPGPGTGGSRPANCTAKPSEIKSTGSSTANDGSNSDAPDAPKCKKRKRSELLKRCNSYGEGINPRPASELNQHRLEHKQGKIADGSRSPTSRVKYAKFRAPLLSKTVLERPLDITKAPVPRHDTEAAGALVMKRPAAPPTGKRTVDVVVDPILTKHLRAHQREGVAFLYECVMGMRSHGGEGAILADEMGLGKTLQTIALLWTLLKQNPVYEDPPVVKKALIVCPVTLVTNWRKEFWKWLGKERLGVFVADNEKRTKITDFTLGRAYQVMIIGYEKLCLVQEDLQKGSGVDIVIADEAHRLKSAHNQAAAAIRSLNTDRRIVLTGTPMQNNLSEYYTLIDLVNPGILGKASVFKRKFEDVILAGHQLNAHSKNIKASKDKSQELTEMTEQFILRRTADVIAQFLPPKTEYVLFCRPEPAQLKALRSAVNSPYFYEVLGNRQASLQLIHVLKQICNCPSLIKAAAAESSEGVTSEAEERVQGIVGSIEVNLPPIANASVKLRVLDGLLQNIRQSSPEEKVVIVSGYTSTLDLIQRRLSWGYLRLDGSTATAKRGLVVEQFNKSPAAKHFVFLLSAKAGGVGLNLIGASRLILFDTDWNPATDLQAMARIHRDGQKRHCRVYRLLVKGAIDEKIFQRQISKRELADEIVDSRSSVKTFSQEELKDLFTVTDSDGCLTHEILGCDCGGKGTLVLRGHEPSLSEKADDGNRALEDDAVGSQTRLPKRTRFKPAITPHFDEEGQQEERGGKKDKMKTLMNFRHIDAMTFAQQNDEDLKEVLDDVPLVKFLRDAREQPRVAFIFAKCAGGSEVNNWPN